jgi:hypothetical protein
MGKASCLIFALEQINLTVMKKLLSATFICVLMAASFTAFGQESDEQESKEKESERTLFEEQERASERSRITAEESRRSSESSRARAEESRRSSESSRARAEESERSSGRARTSYRELEGTSYFTKPAYPTAPTMSYSTGDGVFIMSSSGSSSSQLSLSKKFDGQSSDNDGNFDVDESVRHISLSLSGSVTEGAIYITITLPDGDELKDISIDTSADIQFTQSIKISADEDRYYGQWEYAVESDEAVGHYRLSIQTR